MTLFEQAMGGIRFEDEPEWDGSRTQSAPATQLLDDMIAAEQQLEAALDQLVSPPIHYSHVGDVIAAWEKLKAARAAVL